MNAELDAEAMKTQNHLPIQAVLFERSLYSQRGGFDEDLEMLEDWALWQKHLRRTRFVFAPKTTSFYRTPLHAAAAVLRMEAINATYHIIANRLETWRLEWDDNMKNILARVTRRLRMIINGNREMINPLQSAVSTLQAELRHLQGVVTGMQINLGQTPGSMIGLNEGASAGLKKIDLLFPLGHFYSPIADPVDIAARKASLFCRKPNSVGIDYREDAQLELLAQIKPHIETIDYPVADPKDNLTYFYENDQFPVLDAEFLYAALLHYKPKTMIEVGSGYSSLITADVNRRLLGGALNFICIEPFPRQFLIDGVEGISHLEISKVEDLPLSYFEQLEADDIFFIDSSHVSKVGSDVNYLFFEVIPRLKPGVIVHVHDIFLPDDYPEVWALDQNRNWNEQYVLHAFLQFNSEWRILWAAHLMNTRHTAEVQKVFTRFPKLGGGGSLWMQRV